MGVPHSKKAGGRNLEIVRIDPVVNVDQNRVVPSEPVAGEPVPVPEPAPADPPAPEGDKVAPIPEPAAAPESIPGGDVLGDWNATARAAQERDAAKQAEQAKNEQPAPEVSPADKEPPAPHATCQMCHEEVPAPDYYSLELCGHKYCLKCLYEYAKEKLQDIGSDIEHLELQCPLGTCGVNISVDDLKTGLAAFGNELHLSRFLPVPVSSEGDDEGSGSQERSLRQSQHQPSEKFPISLTQSLEIFISQNQNYVRCPNRQCGLIFERVPLSKRDPRRDEQVQDDNGKPLSADALEHYLNHRFRCRNCTTVFCAQCKLTPYHLGKTCRQHLESLHAKKCRFCGTRVEDTAMPFRPDGVKETWLERWRRKRLEAKRRQQCTDLTQSKLNAILEEREAEMEAAGEFFICEDELCQEKVKNTCLGVTPCQHLCGGVRDERVHLRCLKPGCCDADGSTSEDFCNICWVDPLGGGPCIELVCGHIFHYACVEQRLQQGPATTFISFKFANCPLCQQPIDHPSLSALLNPIRNRERQLRDLAAQRLKIEFAENDDALKEGGEFFGQPVEYALRIFAFYECYQCGNPFYGGRKACDPGAQAEEEAGEGQGGGDKNRADRLCSGCCGLDAKCKTHGTDYIEYKCRFCCALATFFCGGKCHYCTPCHDMAGTLTNFSDWSTKWDCDKIKPCAGMATCPLGILHAKNGEEYSLGCAMCRADRAREEAEIRAALEKEKSKGKGPAEEDA